MCRKLVLFACLIGAYGATGDIQCKYDATTDISDGKRVGSDILKDNLRYPAGQYYKNGSSTFGCVCSVKTCIRKCCPIGQAPLNRSCENYDTPLVLSVYNDDKHVESVSIEDYYLLDVSFCPKKKYLLDPSGDVDKFYIQRDGKMYMPNVKEDNYVLPVDYCVDTFVIGGNLTLSAKVCGELTRDAPGKIVYSVGMMVSIPFLLATLFVYAVLPEKRNLHGKCLMCFVSSLTLAYIFLIYIQLDKMLPSETAPCVTLGVLCLFFFLVSFFWMNVMCTDIWLTFSGKRNASDKGKDNKRFLLYAAYALSIPIVLSIIVAIVNTTYYDDLNQKSKWFYPGIANGQCWLHDGFPTLIYFYGPMSILITLNVIFFIKTALLIKGVKKDTKILNRKDSKTHGNEEEKQQMFKLYMKLLMVMGINWSMEVISWAVIWAYGRNTYPQIWYLTDFCNALYGVFIFFIFVFKKKTWRSLQKRYYTFIGKPMQGHLSSSATAHTRSSAVTSDDGETESGGVALKSIVQKS